MDDKNSTMMMVNNKTPEISVIFYDGEREMELGAVEILPVMTFKLLQSTLSNKIGISPNHITIYLDRSAAHHHHHHRRRHPVTSKFDFDSLRAASAGCFFWVVLKRGRRNRRRHNGKTDAVKLILPRGGFDNWSYLEYVNRLRMIDQIERDKERYLMSLNLNSNVYNELSGYQYNSNYNHNQNYNHHHQHYNSSNSNYSDDYDFDADIASCSTSTGGGSSETATRVYCDVCYNSGETAVPFHWCKNDAVVTSTTRARSTVGPIAPPLKNGLYA